MRVSGAHAGPRMMHSLRTLEAAAARCIARRTHRSSCLARVMRACNRRRA
ncbi:hypothetical protein BPC006_II1840 [Burkholderia pseudomallei BPC006]|uniref:Uncharacterized protein n=1 Tax=Burkholderia pseudomallei 1710a TaxID=320371 RepID=A0A0E1VY32_BURPE|nr:hypothetical protein BPC006_II1840 [Burkholderia pseudomallei BPC006]EET05855.1 hypothetical protein BURPS1710A_A1101 [Burkholderia pseudomallei 1710a]